MSNLGGCYYIDENGIHFWPGETIKLKVRARHKRAIRWPLLMWQFRKAGVSWRTAWRLTHHTIWPDEESA